ncbi:MAG: hypothetical protein ACFFC6_15875 [Promethearchaeota archaeon]
MKQKLLISGIIVLGLLAVVATTVAVTGSVISETVDDVNTEDITCDGTGPHGQSPRKGGNGPMDGTGNQWKSQGPHGDGTCNQTVLVDG